MKRTISVMVGKGSLSHNSRRFHAENTDPARTYLNIEYCNEDIRKVYHELFDDAVARYNEKQGRQDRRIDNYYDKIRSGKQEKPFHEIVIQIGNRDDCGSETADGALVAKILDEYMQDFQKRNPTLRVFSAHLHLDESTHHLHIDFVPYITGSKRGVDTRVSLKQAFASLGFKGGTRSETEWNQWANAEKVQFAQVMERHGIEWERKGTHEEHLSVLEFKKKERSKEVKKLEIQSTLLENNIEYYKLTEGQMRGQLQEINTEIKLAEEKQADATEAAEKAETARAQAQKKADNIQKYVTAYEKDVWEYEYQKKWQLPEADLLMTGKAYWEKKALPLVKKLKDVIRNLTIRLIRAETMIDDLRTKIERKEDKIACLENRVDNLREEVSYYQNRSQDFEYLERVLGRPQIERIVSAQRELEKRQQIIQKRRRSRELSLWSIDHMALSPPCKISEQKKIFR